MCNTNNSLSFKERVKCYINKKEEIEAEYKSKMEALNKKARKRIENGCNFPSLMTISKYPGGTCLPYTFLSPYGFQRM